MAVVNARRQNIFISDTSSNAECSNDLAPLRPFSSYSFISPPRAVSATHTPVTSIPSLQTAQARPCTNTGSSMSIPQSPEPPDDAPTTSPRPVRSQILNSAPADDIQSQTPSSVHPSPPQPRTSNYAKEPVKEPLKTPAKNPTVKLSRRRAFLGKFDDKSKLDDHTDPPSSSPSSIQHYIAYIRARLPIILPDSHFWTMWCCVINILHALNVLVVPLMLAWTEHFLSFSWVAFFAAVDCIMLVDCFLQARSAFQDKYGTVITDHTQMFNHFMWTNHGWWSLASSLPFSVAIAFCLQVQGPSMTIPALEAMVTQGLSQDEVLARFPYGRVYSAQIKGVAPPISRLIKTMLILMWMGLLDACLFCHQVQTVRLSEGGILGSIVPFSTQFLISYVAAVKSLVLKLREVDMDAENIYVLFEFTVGILAYGTVFGNLHSIVEMLDSTAAIAHAEEKHKFEMGWLRTYMRNKGVVPELQKMVHAHKELQWRKSQGMDEAHLFDDIPRSVQQKIKNFLYLDLVRKVPIFQGTDAAFHNSVTCKIKPLHVLDKWFIFQKGDDGMEMYFIKIGHVEIVGAEGQIFVTLGPGSFFGEIALLEECKRTASARAKGHVELCVFTRHDFNTLMKQYPRIAEKIRDVIAERKANEARIKAVQAEKVAAEAKRKAEEVAQESERMAREALAKPRSIAIIESNKTSKKSLSKKPSQLSISSTGVGRSVSGGLPGFLHNVSRRVFTGVAENQVLDAEHGASSGVNRPSGDFLSPLRGAELPRSSVVSNATSHPASSRTTSSRQSALSSQKSILIATHSPGFTQPRVAIRTDSIGPAGASGISSNYTALGTRGTIAKNTSDIPITIQENNILDALRLDQTVMEVTHPTSPLFDRSGGLDVPQIQLQARSTTTHAAREEPSLQQAGSDAVPGEEMDLVVSPSESTQDSNRVA
ncbi:hypothetical protein SeLEV6574_g00088 [Synchytrium endobioticum]|uniref:Cyclic nucleotide-binding domain-containing protein n=1 Tax=Synchytrium endobioticum TaxID=286115 RepID=A0A507DKP0_9FUNG|nr:hypothetical protein SeLEV6574_g00088 [Synchytrium endobioticum]